VRPEGLGTLKNFINLIGYPTSNLPVCCIVLQPLYYRAPPVSVYVTNLRINYMTISVTPRRMESEEMLFCRLRLLYITMNLKCHPQGLALERNFYTEKKGEKT
jgi:hypothetical protein